MTYQAQCPNCTQLIQYQQEQGGMLVACPSCQAQFNLPLIFTSPQDPQNQFAQNPGVQNPEVQNQSGQSVDPLQSQTGYTSAPYQNVPSQTQQSAAFGSSASSSYSSKRPRSKRGSKSDLMMETLSDPEFYKRILQNKYFIIGASSFAGLILIVAIISFFVWRANEAAKQLSSDIPIAPYMVKTELTGEEMLIEAIVTSDETSKFQVYKVPGTDYSRGDIYLWFDEKLVANGWYRDVGQFDWRHWRKGSRRLGVRVYYEDQIDELTDRRISIKEEFNVDEELP